MKKISIIAALLFISIIVCGCEKNTIVIEGKTVNTSKMEHKHCTREATATNAEVSLNYDIYYTGDVLNIIRSEEKVTSTDQDVLDEYERAYNSIKQNYIDLEQYDESVERKDDTVINTVIINYDKLDIKKLIEIEGEEDNIFEDNIPKVSKWLSFAKKFGTKCE